MLRGEGGVFAALRRLREMETWSADRLRAHQGERLAATLAYAYARCAEYGAQWPGQPDPDADPFDVLRALPMIDKATLQARAAGLAARPAPRRVTVKTTGGSTGQAVTVVKDRDALAGEMAASWLGYGWFGIRRGDRAVRFWGSPFTWKRRMRFAAADFAMNRLRFSAFAFGEAQLEAYWRRCLRFRPDWFYGYASMLAAFAGYVNQRGLDGRRLGLTAIVSTSEVLGAPQRRLLEETFGCPVQDEYGCGEVGPIAYACPEGRLHVMADNVVVEALRPDGTPADPGEAGELVITDLNNRAMPLIRYRVGDFGVPAEGCACGRPFPALERVAGRAYDFVQGPDGRRYHGEFFMYLFEEMRQRGLGVDQFQVVQTTSSAIRVDVVAPGEPRPEQADHLRVRLGESLPGMRLEVRRVPAIARERSGKLRVIVNRAAEAHPEPVTAGPHPLA